MGRLTEEFGYTVVPDAPRSSSSAGLDGQNGGISAGTQPGSALSADELALIRADNVAALGSAMSWCITIPCTSCILVTFSVSTVVRDFIFLEAFQMSRTHEWFSQCYGRDACVLCSVACACANQCCCWNDVVLLWCPGIICFGTFILLHQKGYYTKDKKAAEAIAAAAHSNFSSEHGNDNSDGDGSKGEASKSKLSEDFGLQNQTLLGAILATMLGATIVHKYYSESALAESGRTGGHL